MKIKIIINALLFLMVPFACATTFEICNESSALAGYVLIHSGQWRVPFWQFLEPRFLKNGCVIENTWFGQLIGIWIMYRHSSVPTFYFADVSFLNIPITKLNVPIRIEDDGYLIVAGKRVYMQQMQQPRFN